MRSLEWAPHHEINVLMKRKKAELSLSNMWIYSKKVAICKPGKVLSKKRISPPLDLGLLDHENYEK